MCPRELHDPDGKTTLVRVDQLIVFTKEAPYQGVYKIAAGDTWGLTENHRLRVDCETLRLVAVDEPRS